MAEPLTPEQRLRRAVFTLSDHYWDDSDQALRMTSAINEISAVADSLDAARAAAPAHDDCPAARERDELREAAGAVIDDWESTDEDEEYLSPEFAPKMLALRAALHREAGA